MGVLVVTPDYFLRLGLQTSEVLVKAFSQIRNHFENRP